MRTICSNVIVFLLFFCLFSVTRVEADVLNLRNGDRITGSILRIDDGKITIRTDYMGTVSLPWSEIASATAETPLHVTFSDGDSLRGTFIYSENAFAVITAETESIYPSEAIVAVRNDNEERNYLRLKNPGLLSLWRGTGTVGFAGTTGNSETSSFTTGLNAERVTRNDKTSLYFSIIKASAKVDGVSENTAEAVRGGISYSYNASERFFYNLFNDYEYDRFQDLDLRFAAGGGMGYKAIKTAQSSLDIVAGSAYSRAKYSTPLTRNSAELYWGNEYTIKINSAVSVIQSYRMFNDLTNTGMFRVNFNIGLNTKIREWLSWNVSVTDRYVSNPAPGRMKNDFIYTTGIGLSFRR